uniref:phosphopantetheine-binding protein n=1 Tax=Chamaesiphon sp. VAR_69_metabat_338 TaxID=2964704 RepID=UPI00286E5BBF
DRAEPSLTCFELQQRVQMQIFQETELVIDPAFFTALQQRFPQIDRVQIQLMRGKHHNELVAFRYNAILHISDETVSIEPVSDRDNYLTLNWSEANLTISAIRQLLIDDRPERLNILNIPNARVISAVKTVAWLAEPAGYKTVGQIRKALQEIEMGIDPADWDTIDLPYSVDLTWSSSSSEGNYDVMFIRQDALTERTISQQRTTDIRPWQAYANNPLQAKAARQLVPQLQSYLAQKLPEYMLPSVFVVLESLPLTANGKVDRRALQALSDPIASRSPNRDIAPRTPVESVLASIFTEVLGLKRVGIYDNFFELGGHSLLATQLVSRVRDALQVELPLRSVFEASTIDRLATVVESLQHDPPSQAPALVPLSRESRRMKLPSSQGGKIDAQGEGENRQRTDRSGSSYS